MNRPFFVVIVLAFAGTALGADKLPVPEQDAQQSAMALVQQIYKDSLIRKRVVPSVIGFWKI